MDVKVRLGRYARTRAGWELTPEELRTAIYIVGAPDQGKSTTIGNGVEDAADRGEAVLVLDIKGDLVRDIAARTKHPDRVVWFAPGEAFRAGRVWAYNQFDFDADDTERRERTAQDIPQVIERLGMANLSSMQNIATTLTQYTRLALGTKNPTLLDLYLMLLSPPYLRAVLQASDFAPSQGYFSLVSRLDKHARQGLTLTTANRLSQLLDPPVVHLTLGQPRSTFTLERFLREGRLILCNLGDGLDRAQGIEFGNLIMAEFIALTFARPRDERQHTWRAAVDEFHLFVGKVLGEIISQARSYNTYVTLAHQGLHQLGDGEWRQIRAFKGDLNYAGVKIFFATSAEDRLALAQAYGLRWAEGLHTQERHHARAIWRSGPTRRVREADIIGDDWHHPELPGQLAAIQARDLAQYTRRIHWVQRYVDLRYWRWLPQINYAALMDGATQRTRDDDTLRRNQHEYAAETQAQGARGQSPPVIAPAAGAPPRESLRFGPDPAGTPGAGGPVPLRHVDQSADILSPFPRRRGTGRSRPRE